MGFLIHICCGDSLFIKWIIYVGIPFNIIKLILKTWHMIFSLPGSLIAILKWKFDVTLELVWVLLSKFHHKTTVFFKITIIQYISTIFSDYHHIFSSHVFFLVFITHKNCDMIWTFTQIQGYIFFNKLLWVGFILHLTPLPKMFGWRVKIVLTL